MDERLVQQTIRTGLNGGHCGHSKFLVNIADTYCAEISHHIARKGKYVFSAMDVEIAQ